MNRQEAEILLALADGPFAGQRELAERCACSLGAANKALKSLRENSYISETDCKLTEKARRLIRGASPENAVILAAGFGMRMVPINTETPKAFLELGGERLIERLIRQLREAGIKKIFVVAGFMKEQFEYLMDDFGVELIINSEYSSKNNLHSLARALQHLGNTYILPSDIRCGENPFRSRELFSWYMVGDEEDRESFVRPNRKLELVRTQPGEAGSYMTGIAYLTKPDAEAVKGRIKELCKNPAYDNAYWESALFIKEGQKELMIPKARAAKPGNIVEINTYEQLRSLDEGSSQLKSEAIFAIAKALGAKENEITDIAVLKKGMTNRSFCFVCRGKKYIMRIPGEGTELLINRRNEAAVFRAISGRGLCDDPVYMDPEKGFKITEFIEGVRCCDPESKEDLEACMSLLKSFHEMKLRVAHEFDIFRQIEFYESLREGRPSVYRDYALTKRNVFSLRGFIEENAGEKVLAHIDAVPDNFLFCKDGSLQLTDWEYAGMQDPHADIAMFCIYSLYGREQTDRLISIYFGGDCPKKTRIKIYCYIAACGLLWSNWCEYKSMLGVEFGEYSLRQYRYAKDYFRIAAEEIKRLGEG